MTKCSPREIIKEVPDVQTVILPVDWFDDLDPRRSVFASLYEWMLENGRVPADVNHTLHNRTLVGENLYKRLRDAERSRLKKKHKFKGEDLESALSWSDIDSGPRTEISGYDISGDVLLVVPESSFDALNDFRVSFSRRTREAAIKKVRAHAAGATFYQWLLSQLERPDRVGDLARDAQHDEKFPRDSNDYEEIRFHIRPRWDRWQYDAVVESLKQGWMEYLQQYPGRVLPAAWCSECEKKLEIKDAFLAWSIESPYELFVMDAPCIEKYNEFDTLTARPLSSITPAVLEELVEKEDVSDLDVERWEETLRLWGILPPVTEEGWVYFVRSAKTHAVKIGFTAGDVADRLAALQTAHPYKLEVLGKSRGNREYEKSLHSRFAKLRLEGEWFEPHPDLLAFIAVLPSR